MYLYTCFTRNAGKHSELGYLVNIYYNRHKQHFCFGVALHIVVGRMT